MSDGIQLEVGKRYRSRCGDVWECVDVDDSFALPFRCKSGERDTWFAANGGFWSRNGVTFSDDDLIEEVVDEDEIPPGSIVPPEKLELAREMCRNGEPFFITAKCNGPGSGYLPASAERTWEWDSDWFYIKRGPLTSESDDPQGDVELRDDGVIAEPEPQVTIEPGEEFTADDTEKVAAAKRLQALGSVFEVLTDEDSWRVPPWTIRFNSDDFRYRRKPEEVQSGGEGDGVVDEPQGIKLEVGKKYRSRRGDVWECVRCSRSAKHYPFVCYEVDDRSVGDAFGENGRQYEFTESENDLIEEVVDDPRQADDVHSMREQIDPEAAEELCEEYSYTLTGTQLRRELLRQVESCVCADRQNTYGDAEDNFENIANLANVALQNKLAEPLDAADVAIFSICIKLARLIESPHHIDNWIDGAGYFICGGGIATRSKQDN